MTALRQERPVANRPPAWPLSPAANSGVCDGMTSPTRQKESRSSRVYAWLLELYPPAFLQRHRAEMLQNFADLEDAAASKSELWLLIGKDLTMSLISHFFASRIGRYVIGVLVAWILLFTIGYSRRGSTPGHPVLHVFGGFLLGMLSVYIATRFYRVLQKQLVRDRRPCRVDIAFRDWVFSLWQPTRPSGFACLRRLSARHAVHVHCDAFLRTAAKQLARLECRMRVSGFPG
jgi:hypothetical protein